MPTQATTAPTMSETPRIPSRGRSCARCSGPFLPGDHVHSVLRFAPHERCDYCSRCHESLAGESQVVYWRTRRPEPRAKDLRIDLDALGELFGRLLAENTEAGQGLRFVVALLLSRKRKAKLAATPAGGSPQDLYVLWQGGEQPIHLPAPDLSPENLEALKQQLLESVRWD
jgi:hypothetical protein